MAGALKNAQLVKLEFKPEMAETFQDLMLTKELAEFQYAVDQVLMYFQFHPFHVVNVDKDHQPQ